MMQMEYDAAFIESAKQSSLEFSRKELGQDIYVIRETHNYLFFGPVRKDEKNTTYFAALYLFKKRMHLQPGQKVTLYDHEGEFGVALVGQAQNRQVWVWLLSFDTNEIVKKSISLVHAVTGVQSPDESQVCRDALNRYEKRSSRKRIERSMNNQQYVGSPLLSQARGSPFSSAPASPALSPSTSLSRFSNLSLDTPDPFSQVDSSNESPSRTPLSARRLRSQGRNQDERQFKRTRRFDSRDSASEDEDEDEIEYDSDEEEAEDEHDIIEDSEDFINYGSPRDGRSPRSPRRSNNNRNRRSTLSPIKKREINNQLNKKENMRMFMKLLEYVLTITENPDAEEDDK